MAFSNSPHPSPRPTRAGRFRSLGSVSLLGAAILAASMFSVAPVNAQGAGDKAAAEALFDEGTKLLKAGNYEEACKKLESSQRVDPGIGTLLYLGECYKKAGRTASAWATFREAASKAEAAGEADRARAGKKRADELEASLSRVTFDVAEENREVEDLVVRQGEVVVNRALWGSPIPVDPGQLKVVAEAPGYERWETTVLVAEGGSAATLTIPPLVKLPQAAPPPPEEPPKAEPAEQVTVTPEEVKKPGSGQRTVGLVVAGLGVVGVGVGSVFGLLAMQSESDAREFCDGATCQKGTDGVALTDDARKQALVSTIGFAAGGVLLAGGLTLYFTAPKKQEAARLLLTPALGGGHFSYKASF